MPLQPTTAMNVARKRDRTVKYINSLGKSQNAIVRAITSSTVTLYLPHEHRQITTVAKATSHRGPGFHRR